MIRVYFDWNVVSYLKQPEFVSLKEYVEENKSSLIFPYSAAHFSDLMKSYSVDNKFFQIDLDNLQWLSDKHLLHWEDDFVKPMFCTPTDYFKGYDNDLDLTSLLDIDSTFNYLDKEMDENGLSKKLPSFSMFREFFKSVPSNIQVSNENQKLVDIMFPDLNENASSWDVMLGSGKMLQSLMTDREYYKNLRSVTAHQGFNLDRNAGNWDPKDVIRNIDSYLVKLGLGKDFLSFVDYVFELRNEKPNPMVHFLACYNMLDLMGYKADKLPKPTDTAMNIQTDAQHAYYAAHCDFFIVSDKNLAVKAKVLYHFFGIQTKVISPREMKDAIENRRGNSPKSGETINEIFALLKDVNSRVDFPEHAIDGGTAFSCKLPQLYFDFFTDVSVLEDPENKRYTFSFFRRSRNISNFYFYTEVESLLQQVFTVLKWNPDKSFSEMATDLMNNDNVVYTKLLDFGVAIIDLEDKKLSPKLTYIIPYE